MANLIAGEVLAKVRAAMEAGYDAASVLDPPLIPDAENLSHAEQQAWQMGYQHAVKTMCGQAALALWPPRQVAPAQGMIRQPIRR